MAELTDVVLIALTIVNKLPVFRLAGERTIRVVFAGGTGIFLVSLTNPTPAVSVLLTALGAVIIEITGSYGTGILMRRRPEGMRHDLKALLRAYFVMLRIFLYLLGASALFTLAVPIQSFGWRSLLTTFTAAIVAFAVEFAIIVLREGAGVLKSEELSKTAEAAVTSDAPADEAEVSAVDLDAQLAFRYDRAREASQEEVRKYLPDNPRTAKRMVNHISLAMAIAEQRGLFRDGTITQEQLAKWIGFAEQWPAVAAALTTRPGRMAGLEQAKNVGELEQALDRLVPGTRASVEMLDRLHAPGPLGPILDRLVRYEAG